MKYICTVTFQIEVDARNEKKAFEKGWDKVFHTTDLMEEVELDMRVDPAIEVKKGNFTILMR